MKKVISYFGAVILAVVFISSCTTLDHSMREPNTKVNLNKSDFALSDQVTGDATTVTIFGIDWARLFMKRSGSVNSSGASGISLSSIPVVGGYLGDRTASYSLYQLMTTNPGYDVVFYPQYETKIIKPILGIGFLTKITIVKTTARLGKLNK